MKRIFFLLSLLTCVFLLAACKSTAGNGYGNAPGNTGGTSSVSEQDLLHHNFVLVSVDGKEFKSSKTPNLEFNEGFRMAGSACNRLLGQAKLANNTLVVEQMVSTKMLCFETELNELEYLLSNMLQAGVNITLSGESTNKMLTLKQGTHTLVYKLQDFVK